MGFKTWFGLVWLELHTDIPMKHGYFEKHVVPVPDTYRRMVSRMILLHMYRVHEIRTQIFSS